MPFDFPIPKRAHLPCGVFRSHLRPMDQDVPHSSAQNSKVHRHGTLSPFPHRHTPRKVCRMTVNCCTIHRQIEVTNGVWRFDPLISAGYTPHVQFKEEACPICMSLARATQPYCQDRPVMLSTHAALIPA